MKTANQTKTTYTIAAHSWHGDAHGFGERTLNTSTDEGIYRTYHKARKRVCGMATCSCPSRVYITRRDADGRQFELLAADKYNSRVQLEWSEIA